MSYGSDNIQQAQKMASVSFPSTPLEKQNKLDVLIFKVLQTFVNPFRSS